ncbi:hypothetical protein PS928_03855 [Pseudomonas fluorescens]|uniref:Uncharacterized protein n=1 Tax=Pseudomonas fluorescens TaxID=294 RepID=A0A5E7URK7_PSEFL|nr:hypothetical protein PS928_03855 [Pseudomonas fluorescens]
MPAKAALSLAAPTKTPSPASRAPTGDWCRSPILCSLKINCRSWLASEGGLESCGAHEDAFAGKPGSYRGLVSFADFVFTENPCRSWLASEGGLESCGGRDDAFAGKPGSYRGLVSFADFVCTENQP